MVSGWDLVKVKLLIQPIGFSDRGLLYWLGEELKQRFPVPLDVKISLWSTSLDYFEAFNWGRMQFRAVEVNMFLRELYKGFVKPRENLVLGLVAGDGYVEGLNFVFGLATPELSIATVYTFRLESRDYNVYQLRVLKEVIHEVGHLLGLEHCSDRRCVMSFSNSVLDVDFKEPAFCQLCRSKLKRLLRV